MRRRRCQISDESKAMTTEVLLPRRLGSTWMLAWPARIGIGFIFAGILLVSKGQAFILPSARGFTGTHIRQSSTIRRGCVKEMLAMSERRGLWPSKQTIDFRSDTVTLPTAGMRKAMHKVSFKTAVGIYRSHHNICYVSAHGHHITFLVCLCLLCKRQAVSGFEM